MPGCPFCGCPDSVRVEYQVGEAVAIERRWCPNCERHYAWFAFTMEWERLGAWLDTMAKGFGLGAFALRE
jgi:hypothetical protein